VLDETPPEQLAESNLASVVKRSFLGLRGDRALAQGAVDLSAHHHVFPDAKLRKQLVRAWGVGGVGWRGRLAK
jgi:hypothetical protein